jgi:hypothetical protein
MPPETQKYPPKKGSCCRAQGRMMVGEVEEMDGGEGEEAR